MKVYFTRIIFALMLLIIVGALVFGAVRLTAYIKTKAESAKVDTTTVYIEKSGKIKETIVEDFDETSYSEDKLKKMIDDETAAYGKGVDAGDLKVSEGKAYLKMTYASGNDYSSFNEETFYSGKLNDLITRGVSFDADALSAGGDNAVVLGTSLDVVVPSDIIYTSSNAVINKDNPKKATVSPADGELAYIIY